MMGWLNIPREADGTARLPLLGATLVFRQTGAKITPTSKETEIVVEGAFDDPDAIGPLDNL